MTRSRGDMASPRQTFLLLASLSIVALCRAGPLGPLPNVTSADVALKEGSCALGDVVYMPGDEFPGSDPCESCKCTGGDVQCARQRCEPRPGCKALHRPDHCCPTYQCECEQEGRVYGNGEKLVDPADPCRVCYCQGGEVVCRRIACFVRDDCTPRLVPGRCCPEYDNCPLRGVTSLPGVSSSIASSAASESVESQPAPPKENIKQEITIKEITPVSEIPIITDVKIKEILPSPSIEVAEYSSSKSPLIPREATSERNIKENDSKTESPSIIEIHSSLPVIVTSPDATQFTATENKNEDTPPSKISFSTQDSTHSAIYPSNVPIVATMGIPPVTSEPVPVATTKAPIIEEEDFDHNPAFPPLPDDLAVLRNHEDEIVPEQVVDNDHVSGHDITVANMSPTVESESKDPLTTTSKDLPDTTTVTTTEKPKTSTDAVTTPADVPQSTEAPSFKENPTINLRSAIPTEILNEPTTVVHEEPGTSEIADTKTSIESLTPAVTTTQVPQKIEEVEVTTEKAEISTLDTSMKTSTEGEALSQLVFDTTTHRKETEIESGPFTTEQEQTTSSLAKSNVATEVTSQTELSSLPIETSDQNPPALPSENTTHDKETPSTVDPIDISSKIPSTSSEVITVSRSASSDNIGLENVETTEFIVTSFGSSETATDAVELIKISANPEKSAAIIESADGKKTNDFTDLINLVRDVASISDNTEEPDTAQHVTTTGSISDSEELIPVNAGYKSKNKNFNQNSITEVPHKSKIATTVNKQKVVEIEDDESESVTDSPPPFDKVEPTTRRPIIDNVSDDVNIAENKTQQDKKDIEIITQSYVPTINHRRPTKVVMKKSNEKPASSGESLGVSTTTETSTDSSILNETPIAGSGETERKEKISSDVTQAVLSTDSPTVTTAAPASSTDAPASTTVTVRDLVTTAAPSSSSEAATTAGPAGESSATSSAPPSTAQ
ncbi:mucin-5AC [Spodoptera frugiperda]|uniref:Mucin-5AC n=1 Tax=Spodoptera frugiperda TaxID=7108 RepID=A0A9R0D0P7_SPOFR|nr:mucin-5AC [Spodoptera frugiperda]